MKINLNFFIEFCWIYININSCKFEIIINKIYCIYFYYKWRSFGIVFLVFMCLSVKYLDFRIKRFLLFRYLRRILMVDLFWFFVLARDIVVIVLMLEFLFFRRFFKELMIDVFWYLFEKKKIVYVLFDIYWYVYYY